MSFKSLRRAAQFAARIRTFVHTPRCRKVNVRNRESKFGRNIYEPWMDYKGDYRRVSTTTDAASNAAPSRYRFASEYAESVPETPMSCFCDFHAFLSKLVLLVKSLHQSLTLPAKQGRSGSRNRRAVRHSSSGSRRTNQTALSGRSSSGGESREPTGSVVRAPVRSAHRTPPPPYREQSDYFENDKLAGQIEFEVKTFCSWTVDGRENVVAQDYIGKIYFPDL
uniref:Uncharacterized protein n=1 Tax=Haemonchus contortus TaxID=6289 RepID=A0A7I4Y7W9_HAECO